MFKIDNDPPKKEDTISTEPVLKKTSATTNEIAIWYKITLNTFDVYHVQEITASMANVSISQYGC